MRLLERRPFDCAVKSTFVGEPGWPCGDAEPKNESDIDVGSGLGGSKSPGGLSSRKVVSNACAVADDFVVALGMVGLDSSAMFSKNDCQASSEKFWMAPGDPEEVLVKAMASEVLKRPQRNRWGCLWTAKSGHFRGCSGILRRHSYFICMIV